MYAPNLVVPKLRKWDKSTKNFVYSLEANIIDFICSVGLLTRISFFFIPSMLKKDIVKKVEIYHFLSILILSIVSEFIYVYIWSTRHLGGLRWTETFKLYWQSTDSQGPFQPLPHLPEVKEISLYEQTDDDKNEYIVYLYCPIICFDKKVKQTKTKNSD